MAESGNHTRRGRRGGSLRRVVFAVHLWVGLAVGLFVSIAGITGSLLVFRHEIDRALCPHLLCVEPRSERVSVDAVLRSVRAAYPEGRPVRVGFPRTPGGTFEVWLDSGEGRRVYVDPYTGAVLGSRLPRRTLIGFTRLLHVQLLSGKTGEVVAGVFGLLLILLIGTGLVLWWPGLRGVARSLRIDRTARWRPFLYQIHRTLGAVAGSLLLTTVLAGVCLTFDGTFRQVLALVSEPAAPEAPALPPGQVDAAPLALDRIASIADEALPEARTTWVVLPATPQSAVTVRKRLPGEAQYNGKSYVYLHPSTGEVLRIVHARHGSLGTQAANLRYPVHTGEIGGPWLRGLVALLGLAPALLLVTGLLSWWLRRRGRMGPASTTAP